jgi:N,N'-diacetylchitobiose transport system substrate-binding protein
VLKFRYLVAPAAVLALVATASAGCGSSKKDSGGGAETGTLKVWLMNGSAPDAIVNDINKQVEAKYKGLTVKVELQQWEGIQEKLTTALADNNPPDVVEIGNTLSAKFASSGALADLSASKGDLQSSQWNKAMAASANYQGKLYGIPELAGNRAVLYNTDMFAAAGVKPPTSFNELLTTCDTLRAKHNNDPQFSALYFPGRYWYGMLSFVWDAGGDIAKQSGGKWTGTLDSPQAVQGLQNWKTVLDHCSKAPADKDEADDADHFGAGTTAMILDPAWQTGVIAKAHPELKPKIAAFALPGTHGDAPNFLGGSNLSVSANAKHPKAATYWLKLMSGATFQKRMMTQGGVIPNRDSIAQQGTSDPVQSVYLKAAKAGHFVPVAPNWGNVESGNALKDLGTAVASGKDITAAAKDANTKVAQALNSGS